MGRRRRRGPDRGGPEGADGDGDGEFEVVARGRERQRGGSGVSEPERLPGEQSDEPHHGEVRQQREGDTGHIPRPVGDLLALQGEQQHNREQQAVQRPRSDLGKELLFVPVAALRTLPDQAGGEAGDQGDAEEDEDIEGDLPDRDLQSLRVQSEPSGSTVR